jgi:hypothetical protein
MMPVVDRLRTRLRTRLGEIRPARPPASLNRRVVYSTVLVAMAVLIGIAWLNNSDRVAVATLLALILGVLALVAATRRTLLTMAVAILWWCGTAPAVALISAAGLPTSQLELVMSSATTTNIGLGVVVWLAAVLMRAPRPAFTVMACWVLNLLVVIIFSLLLPAQAWLAGFVVTVAVLVQRSGALARLRSVRRGVPVSGDAPQAGVTAATERLPRGFAVQYGLTLPDVDGEITVVIGPTGTYALSGLAAGRPVRTVSDHTRLAMGSRRLDARVNAAAAAALEVQELIRTPVRPALVVVGDEFEEGLVRLTARPRPGTSMETIVVRDDLAAGRLAYGPAILTTGQVSRIGRRVARVAAGAVADAEVALVA